MTSTPMARDEARAILTAAMRQVAPDVEIDTLAPETSLRADLELDSLDFEHLVAQLSDRTGHRIDEDDYARLTTIGECLDYLTA